MSTIQLDFQFPQRFDLEYVGADNARHRPIMIHRALFGSVERFMGVLLEHYAGALPTWLAPEQVVVLPVRDENEEYAAEVVGRLRAGGLRVSADAGLGRTGCPHPAGQVAEGALRAGGGRRRRGGGHRRGEPSGLERPERDVPLGTFADDVAAEVAARRLPEAAGDTGSAEH